MKRKVSLILAMFIILNNISSMVYAQDVKLVENINNLVIFIDFNDTNTFEGDEIKARKIEATFNDFRDDDNDKLSNKDSISLKSYIYDISKGKTIVDSTFYPKSKDGRGYLSYKAPKDKEYYANQSMGSTTEYNLIKDAFNSVKDEITLSKDDLDNDGDGKVDSVTFVFSGIPAINGGSILRQHKSEIPGIGPMIDGKEVEKYNIVAEGSPTVSGSNIYNKNMLGTITHEFLHMIDYPDLYKNGTNAKYVGIWDLMSDSKLIPQLPLVYSRNTYGKANLKVQEITESGVYTLNTSSKTNSDDVVAFKVKSKLYPNEYFMIEYRKNDKKWDEKLQGSGIIVYRINESARGDWGNDQNGIHVYVFRPNDSSPNSGLGDINNAYLSQEVFRTTFGVKSENPYEFNSQNIYFSNGANSNIVISEVGSASSDKITFKIDIPKESEPIVGNGTLSNPYQIKNTDHIFEMIINPNAHFVLANDIDFSKTESKPIGSIDRPFNGSLNGNGHKISNLTINSTDDTTGFIGELGENGIIKNINFENININSTGYTTGSVVGRSDGAIENVRVTGKIVSSSDLSIGGIVGETHYNSKLINCLSDVSIVSKSNGSPLVGGLVGNASDSLIKNNYFRGKIDAQPSNKIGGVFGRNIISSGNDIGNSIDNIFNITISNIKNGVSEITMPQFGETDKGVVGIELLKDVNLNVGSISNEIVSYTNSIVGSHNIKSNNTAIATVSDNKIRAVSKGSTEILYELILGDNKIRENIDVKVVPSLVEVNELPEINANDVKLKVGNKYNPLSNVSASDKEDGNLTSKIKVIENSVDTTKVGEYKVVYKVIDSKGASVTKSIKVIVENDKFKIKLAVNTIKTTSETIIGTGEKGATVKAYVGSKKIGEAKVDSKGNYSINIAAQKNGTKITVKKSKYGYETISASKTVVNNKFKSKLVINTIKTTSKTITGTGEKGATVKAYVGKKKIGEAKVDSKGKYSIKISAKKKGTKITVKESKSGYDTVSSSKTVVNATFKSKLTVNKIKSTSKTVTGKGEKGTTVKAYIGSKKIGEAKVDSKGNYKIKISKKKTGSKITVKMSKGGYTTVEKLTIVKK